MAALCHCCQRPDRTLVGMFCMPCLDSQGTTECRHGDPRMKFQARCICGWVGMTVGTQRAAENDGVDHELALSRAGSLSGSHRTTAARCG